ncbi:MAG TPA: hypothetical protein VFM13_02545 [Gaiellaceae bacterium]|nr:hypothetical protein [Gaiellaceae bacterium]
MPDGVRWVIAIALALVVIGLIVYARGDQHKRGDEVGALRSTPVALVT